MIVSNVSNNYKVTMLNEHKLCLLKHSRIIKKAGETAHIYLPLELEGEEIIGVVVK